MSKCYKNFPYFHNSDPDYPGGNFAQQWNLLQPYFNTPRATIIRTSDIKETIGTLTATAYDATFTCKSLELPWLNNQRNISCIPAGTYQVKYTFSPRFLKYTYEILNVPNRGGIRFHSANYYTDLDGCIGLGNGFADINHDGQLDIINSRLTISAFEGFMNKKDFTLTII